MRMLRSLGIVLLAGVAMAADPVTWVKLKDFSVASGGMVATVEILFDGKPEVRHFAIEKAPPKIVVDIIDGVHGLGRWSYPGIDAGPVASIRTSQFRPAPEPRARFVIDLNRPSNYELVVEGDRVVVRIDGSGETIVELESESDPVMLASIEEFKPEGDPVLPPIEALSDRGTPGVGTPQQAPAGDSLSWSEESSEAVVPALPDVPILGDPAVDEDSLEALALADSDSVEGPIESTGPVGAPPPDSATASDVPLMSPPVVVADYRAHFRGISSQALLLLLLEMGDGADSLPVAEGVIHADLEAEDGDDLRRRLRTLLVEGTGGPP